MPFNYEIKISGELLSARAWGAHDDVEELKRYGAALVAAGAAAECTKALLDERELQHTLNEGDIYFLAEQYSVRAPRLVRLAIVFSEKYTRNVSFWETCAVNRGLVLKVFTSRSSALAWLNGGYIEEYA